MKKGVIYLAGPLTGVTWEFARSWRDKVTKELYPLWDTISPLKGQMDFFLSRAGTSEHDIIPSTTRSSERLPITHTATGMTCQDEYYIRRSDFILANLTGANECSFGSPWEMGFAWALGKMIVSVVEPGSPYDHAFARRRSHVYVSTLDEAITYFKQIAI